LSGKKDSQYPDEKIALLKQYARNSEQNAELQSVWRFTQHILIGISSLSLFIVIVCHIFIIYTGKSYFKAGLVQNNYVVCTIIMYSDMATQAPEYSALCSRSTWQYLFRLEHSHMDLSFESGSMANIPKNSKSLPRLRKGRKRQKMPKIFYHGFAWVLPALIISIICIPSFLEGNEFCTLDFSSSKVLLGAFVSFYLPITTLLSVNLLIFIALIYIFKCRIWKNTKTTSGKQIWLYLDIPLFVCLPEFANMVAFFIDWKLPFEVSHPASVFFAAMYCLGGVLWSVHFFSKKANRSDIKEYFSPQNSDPGADL